ncbi:hypothetical protein LTX96_0003399 [Nakaseomyces glabratus]|nr:hypothetical protein LTX96_0003399 [Nakaseomyces glabratus]
MTMMVETTRSIGSLNSQLKSALIETSESPLLLCEKVNLASIKKRYYSWEVTYIPEFFKIPHFFLKVKVSQLMMTI